MKDAPKLNLTKSLQEFEYAKSLIPGGVLGIRRPYNFVPGEYPVYFEKGDKGYVYDIDGNKYIDYLCAYGPIILGYREKEVDEAVIEQIREKGFCFSLSQTLQNRLAEKINQLIPCAEMSIFVKTGSDATTLAIRLARAYTNRKKIIRCGYHGWHDWCVEVKGGIPEKLYEDIHEIHYNEIGELEELVKKYGDDIAALIVTPVGHPLAEEMQEPKDNFLEKVKEIMHKMVQLLYLMKYAVDLEFLSVGLKNIMVLLLIWQFLEKLWLMVMLLVVLLVKPILLKKLKKMFLSLLLSSQTLIV